MKYFKKEELQCKCGCGLYNITEDMEETLDAIREFSGTPMIVTSGCRCKFHNKAVGGSPTSSHLEGIAVDIAVKDNGGRDSLLHALYTLGIRRIGIAKDFIHFDIDKDKINKRTWLY